MEEVTMEVAKQWLEAQCNEDNASIIQAIEERVSELTAKEFLALIDAMCAVLCGYDRDRIKSCPFSAERCGVWTCEMQKNLLAYPDGSVNCVKKFEEALVKRWKEEREE